MSSVSVYNLYWKCKRFRTYLLSFWFVKQFSILFFLLDVTLDICCSARFVLLCFINFSVYYALYISVGTEKLLSQRKHFLNFHQMQIRFKSMHTNISLLLINLSMYACGLNLDLINDAILNLHIHRMWFVVYIMNIGCMYKLISKKLRRNYKKLILLSMYR